MVDWKVMLVYILIQAPSTLNVIIFNNAFLISKDTLGIDNYNQVKGKRLIGLFRDNELYNVDVLKNAEVINFVRGSENELIGIDKTKSGSINLQIVDKAIEEIRFINRGEGELFPESLFPKNGKRLKDFDWRGDEELKSVEDLFKDDPPLLLPKIQGLEDYIPPLEYVDETVHERVKKAGKASPNKKNKAERSLPQKHTIPNPIIEDKPAPKTEAEDKKQ